MRQIMLKNRWCGLRRIGMRAASTVGLEEAVDVEILCI